MWKKTKRKLADLIRSASFTEVGVALDYSANWQTRVGYGRNVVVTTRPRGYRKFPSWKHRLAKPFLRRHPAVYHALRTRHEWYNDTLRYIDSRVAAGAALLIAPEKPLEISRVCHDPAQMQAAYETGRRRAESSLPEILAFLNHGNAAQDNAERG